MVPNFSLNITCEKSLKEQDDSHGKRWGKNLNKIGIWRVDNVQVKGD